MAIQFPNLAQALLSVRDSRGCVPYEVAKFAATAAAVPISFQAEYDGAEYWVDEIGDPTGVDAGEFLVWLTEVTEKLRKSDFSAILTNG